jgi:hypothetical protein
MCRKEVRSDAQGARFQAPAAYKQTFPLIFLFLGGEIKLSLLAANRQVLLRHKYVLWHSLALKCID